MIPLIRSLLEFQGTVILRNTGGTMELRGEDLALKYSESWLTIYHAGAEHSEHRSHLHLRRGIYRYACVMEVEKGTPRLAFWEWAADAEALRAGVADAFKGPFVMFFASFYDWQRGGAPLPENRARFEQWIDRYGRQFDLNESLDPESDLFPIGYSESGRGNS
jgi:hypothetical protein